MSHIKAIFWSLGFEVVECNLDISNLNMLNIEWLHYELRIPHIFEITMRDWFEVDHCDRLYVTMVNISVKKVANVVADVLIWMPEWQ